MGDDLVWKAVAFVADGIGHAAVLTPEALTKSSRDITLIWPRHGASICVQLNG
jgi:hypothetical protein